MNGRGDCIAEHSTLLSRSFLSDAHYIKKQIKNIRCCAWTCFHTSINVDYHVVPCRIVRQNRTTTLPACDQSKIANLVKTSPSQHPAAQMQPFSTRHTSATIDSIISVRFRSRHRSRSTRQRHQTRRSSARQTQRPCQRPRKRHQFPTIPTMVTISG